MEIQRKRAVVAGLNPSHRGASLSPRPLRGIATLGWRAGFLDYTWELLALGLSAAAATPALLY